MPLRYLATVTAGKQHPCGEVLVRCQLRLLDSEHVSTGVDWRYEQSLCKSILEPHVVVKKDKGAGYVGQPFAERRTSLFATASSARVERHSFN